MDPQPSMDLSSSIAWQCRRAEVVRFISGDVIPIDKIDTDVQWHDIKAYVGVRLKCKKCSESYDFTASEQKAWREDYGFSVLAYPIHCLKCRAQQREIVELKKRISLVLAKSQFEISDHDELVDIAYGLIQLGEAAYIGPRLEQKLYGAAKRSTHPRRQEVVELFRKYKEQSNQSAHPPLASGQRG